MRIFNAVILWTSLAAGQSLKIDSVVVQSDPSVLPFIGTRIFQNLTGTAIDGQTASLFGEIKTYTPFLSEKTHLTFARFNHNHIAAVIDLDSEFTSHISGIFGTGKTPTGSWESRGAFNLHLENMWATAGEIDVAWHRWKAGSQFTEISITEPFLPVIPVGLKMGWKEDLRAGNSLLRSTSVSAIVHVKSGWKWETGLRKTVIRPTENGLVNGFESSTSEMMEIGLSKNSIQHRWLPTDGFSLEALMDVGIEKRSRETSSIFSGKLETAFYRPMAERWILMMALKGYGTFSNNGNIMPAQKVRFGGMHSLRGFREEFFTADWAVIPTVEFRVAVADLIQVTAFMESAVHSEMFDYPVSYGFGMIQQSNTAIIQLFYGLAKGNAPADGTIHIHITGLL